MSIKQREGEMIRVFIWIVLGRYMIILLEEINVIILKKYYDCMLIVFLNDGFYYI